MPYPVAHMLVAAAVAEVCLPRDASHRSWKVAAGAALGLVPDLDFILVWGANLDREWHRGFTHSIVFSVAAGVLWVVARGRSQAREAIAVAAALLSHAALDFLASTHSAGVALFWPFSDERYGLRLGPLLEPHVATSTLSEALRAAPLISLREIAVFLPLFAVIWLARRMSARGVARSKPVHSRKGGSKRLSWTSRAMS